MDHDYDDDSAFWAAVSARLSRRSRGLLVRHAPQIRNTLRLLGVGKEQLSNQDIDELLGVPIPETRPRGRPRRMDARPPKGARGRPRRELDRDAVVLALQAARGNLRQASRMLSVPRTTLSRFVERCDLAWLGDYPTGLLVAHAELLRASGVSPDVARARGYQSVSRGTWRGALEIPIWSVSGRRAWTQYRIDRGRKRWRYENSHDAAAILDVSPHGRQRALDHNLPLYVTESPRKADAAVSRGLACVAVMGVRMLCLDDELWRYVGVAGRAVYIAFDSDAAWNPEVAAAEGKLAEYLRALGAHVEVLRLPGPNKVGLDDYLAGGRTERDLLDCKIVRGD